jgi:hypothetical protein
MLEAQGSVMTSQQTETIYMPLLDEGVDVWRPVLAQRLDGGRFLVVEQHYDRDAEQWAHEPGTIVLCSPRDLDGQQVLAAKAKA